MEIFAYDYKGNKEFTTINDDFDYLAVQVISGDEHVYAYKNGRTGKHPTLVGSVCGCCASYTEYVDEYFVDRDEIDEWLNRGDSYYWYYWLSEKPYHDMETSE